MKKYGIIGIVFVGVAVICAFTFRGHKEADYLLTDFPAEADPVTVGNKIADRFLEQWHSQYGSPLRVDEPRTQITYPDVCTWLGGLWFAQATKNRGLEERLEARFQPLFTTEAYLQPQANHVDNNVFGAVPLELYMQTKDEKYLAMGMKYADTQWDAPATQELTEEEKAWADKGYSWQTRLWSQRKYGVLLLHISFIVILLGALVTNMFGFEGIVHIREGETVSQMRTTEDQRPLPFSIRLDDFKLVRYPGSHSPSSFESFLTIHTEEGERSEHIYMNKVIYEQGYRLYQSSYDADEQGTILTVNNDTAGTGITYAGYLLLLAGMLLTLADKKSRFRQLAKQLKRVTPLLLLAFLPTLSFAQKAETEHLLKNTIPAEQAEQWGRMQIQNLISYVLHGSIMWMNMKMRIIMKT